MFFYEEQEVYEIDSKSIKFELPKEDLFNC